MINSKNSKRALLMSILSVMLCMAMLVGSTFAWFTDSVTSGKNKIQAGNLDVELLMKTSADGDYENITEESAPIFGSGSIAQNNNAETLWEPGKTQVAYLAIKNNGSLALKYKVNLDVQNISKDIYKVMQYDIIPDAQYGTVTSWAGNGKNVVLGTQLVSGSDDVFLGVGETHYFALSIHMDENAGNEYMNGEVNFDLTVLATQTPYENDGFDDQYDAGAEYPVLSSSDLLDALDTAQAGDTILMSSGSYELPEEYSIPAGVSITGVPGTVLNVNGGKKDITVANPETGLTQGLLVNSDNITISGITIQGDVSTVTGEQYKGYNALVRITGNNVTLDNVTLISNTNDSPVVIANTSTVDNTIMIKDCKITAAFKAIHIVDGTVGTVAIDGCNIDAVYPINVNTNSQLKLSVKNSVLKGWTSYGPSVISAEFDNCEFGEGHGYNVIAAYTDTTFRNCSFSGRDIYAYYQSKGTFNFEFIDCNSNGTPITSDNIKDTFDDSDMWNKCTCIVNGTTIAKDENAG